MASPSNASEPESPDDEEEIVEAGFDPLLFWDQYRQTILVAVGIVLLGLVIFGIYEYNQSRRIAAAGAALAQASSDDDYRQVIDKYPGTEAAGNASLILAGKLRDEKKYDERPEVLQTFLDKYPTHPLAHAADLSIAETLDAQRKLDEAIRSIRRSPRNIRILQRAPGRSGPSQYPQDIRAKSRRPAGCMRTSWRSSRTASSPRRR